MDRRWARARHRGVAGRARGGAIAHRRGGAAGGGGWGAVRGRRVARGHGFGWFTQADRGIALLRARLFPPPRWHAQGCTAHVSGAHVRSIGAGRHWRRDTARVGRGAGQLVSDRAGFGWLQFCGLVFVAGAAAAGGALHGGALDRAWPATAM